MRPLLFRLKIALWSLLLSGTLVVGFGIFFLVIIFNVGVDRIDREIRILGESPLHARHPTASWAAEEGPLQYILGDIKRGTMAVQVWDQNGAILFTSTNCPDEIVSMPAPTLPDADPPERPQPVQRPPRNDRHTAPSGHFTARLDSDGDGKVSANEFDGPAEHFAKFDRNGDGYIEDREAPTGPPGHEERRPGRDQPRPGPPSREPRGVRVSVPPPPPRMKIGLSDTIATSGGNWRVGVMGNEEVTLIIGLDLAAFYAEANQFKKAFLIATPFALLLLAAGGWLLANRAMRPVALITATAKGITAKDLSQRVPATSADAELARLTDVINNMLERLEKSYNQAIRFSGDAAHELQTPLTILQGELDNAVQEAESGSEEQQRYSQLLEEVQHLKTVTQKLLLLARADAGRLALKSEVLDLGSLLQDAIDDVEAIAPDRQIEKAIAQHVMVAADEGLLLQVIRNMTTNAVKYGDENGLLRFELDDKDGMACFTLANTGTAIPVEDRERLFDRFHRADKAHNRKVSGSGLGLSLAREIARAHNGDLILNPARDNLIAFTLSIPGRG